MKRIFTPALAVILFVIGILTLSQAQITNPPTLPANTVLGRIGTAGPPEAIPFANFTNSLITALGCTTNYTLVGQGAGAQLACQQLSSAGMTTTAVAPATYGSTTQLVQFTVDAAGRLTAASNITLCPPVITPLLSGTGATFNTPTCNSVLPQYLIIREAGGGGGGGAVVLNAAAVAGGDTIFNLAGSGCVAKGGGFGAAAGGTGGVGGTTGADGACTRIVRIDGQNGQGGQSTATANTILTGGTGGSTPRYGGGGMSNTGATGGAGETNSGGGGSGAGGASAGASGAGGASGEYFEGIISSPASSYTYTVGPGGAGGTAGTRAGGTGAAGRIEVIAGWQ